MDKYGIVPGVGFVRRPLEVIKNDGINRFKTSFGSEWEPEETAGEYIITKMCGMN